MIAVCPVSGHAFVPQGNQVYCSRQCWWEGGFVLHLDVRGRPVCNAAMTNTPRLSLDIHQVNCGNCLRTHLGADLEAMLMPLMSGPPLPPVVWKNLRPEPRDLTLALF